MIDKIRRSPAEALSGLRDGATVLIGGFGTAGMPFALIDALIAHSARDLTIVNNSKGHAVVSWQDGATTASVTLTGVSASSLSSEDFFFDF